MRPNARRAPSAPYRSWRARSRSASGSIDRYAQPRSLNAPPKPSQIWAAAVSSTVTSAPPVVTVVSAPSVFQYAPGADVTRVGVLAGAPHGLVSGATQLPLQSTIPAGHRQTPAWQLCAGAHGMPQPPQLVGSAVTSRQRRPQAASSGGQIVPRPWLSSLAQAATKIGRASCRERV